jgi:hypothetical protein
MEFDVKTLSLLCLATGLGLTVSVQAQVYKWVDENGEVHYSETLPPDFKDKQHDVLDNTGLTRQKNQTLIPPPPVPSAATAQPDELPRDKSGMQRPTPKYNATQIKQQQDAFLLLRYDSDQEILDAMEVEIKQLGYDAQLLSGSRSSLQDAYRGNIAEAADQQRAGQEVDPKLIAEINRLKLELARNSVVTATLNEREAVIREKFGQELVTYRRLTAEAAAEKN